MNTGGFAPYSLMPGLSSPAGVILVAVRAGKILGGEANTDFIQGWGSSKRLVSCHQADGRACPYSVTVSLSTICPDFSFNSEIATSQAVGHKISRGFGLSRRRCSSYEGRAVRNRALFSSSDELPCACKSLIMWLALSEIKLLLKDSKYPAPCWTSRKSILPISAHLFKSTPVP